MEQRHPDRSIRMRSRPYPEHKEWENAHPEFDARFPGGPRYGVERDVRRSGVRCNLTSKQAVLMVPWEEVDHFASRGRGLATGHPRAPHISSEAVHDTLQRFIMKLSEVSPTGESNSKGEQTPINPVPSAQCRQTSYARKN